MSKRGLSDEGLKLNTSRWSCVSVRVSQELFIRADSYLHVPPLNISFFFFNYFMPPLFHLYFTSCQNDVSLDCPFELASSAYQMLG